MDLDQSREPMLLQNISLNQTSLSQVDEKQHQEHIEQMIRELEKFGYQTSQLTMLYSVHPFVSVEQALTYLNIDPWTGKYLHRFMPVWKSKLVTPCCAICKDEKSKHHPQSMYMLGDSHDRSRSMSRRSSMSRSRSRSSRYYSSHRSRSSEKSSMYMTYGDEVSASLSMSRTRKRCIICVEEKSAGRFVAIRPCGHEICKGCMIAHL